MGQYNKAVLTTAGEKLIARALAGEIKLNITKAKTSSYAYPSGTDLKSLTDMQGIKQTATDPATAVYDDTMIQTRVLFSNEEIVSTYYIHNIGLYAMDGTQEVLFCIVTAETPDEMPQYNGIASTSYIYNIQNVVQDAAQLNITVNPSGTATIQDVLERVDATGGDISETVIETVDTVEDKYPVPVVGESVKRFLGKVLTFLRNIRPLTGDITLYVSANTGSDLTGDGTSGNPFKTIQHAIDILPKDLGGYECIIYVASGTYSETLNIHGFSHGVLRLYGSTSSLSDDYKIINAIVSGNTSYVFIKGFRILNTTGVGVLGYNNTAIILEYLRIVDNALSLGPDAIYLAECEFNISNCHVAYHNTALKTYRSYGFSSTWTAGTGNNYGLWSYIGSTIKKIGQQPQGSVPEHCETGGSIFNENGTQIIGPILSGLSCTWGTIRGGYYRHGNLNGIAEIIVQLDVAITTDLNEGSMYEIIGLPTTSTGNNLSVTTNRPRYMDHTYLSADGRIHFIALGAMPVSNAILLNCTYITNS